MQKLKVLIAVIFVLAFCRFASADESNLFVDTDDVYLQAGSSSVMSGNTVNKGSMWFIDSAALFSGSVNNNGGIITDNAVLGFDGFVTIGADGFFQGQDGDMYTFRGGLLSQSISSSWDTSGVNLAVSGPGSYSFESGNTLSGTWKSLFIQSGSVHFASDFSAETLYLNNGSLSSDGIIKIGSLFYYAGNSFSIAGNALEIGGSLADLGGVGGSILLDENSIGDLSGIREGLIVPMGGGNVVPEPASMLLFALGGGVFASLRKRKV